MHNEFLVESPVGQCLLSIYPTYLCQVPVLVLTPDVLIVHRECHLLNASTKELQIVPEGGPMLWIRLEKLKN